jgi:predicted metal-binding membrane protein
MKESSKMGIPMSKKITSDLGFKLSVGVPLLLVAIGGWYLSAVLYQTSSSTGMGAVAQVPIATMANVFTAPDISVVASFLAIWLVGMVAMMFPAMVPIMSVYSGLVTKEEKGNLLRLVGPPLFLGGYLSLYLLLGLCLFAAVYAVFQLSLVLPWLSSFSVVGVATVLFAAGTWQLTPLKEKMLGKCTSPMGFFMTHIKKGISGAFRMGTEHGIYCVGCCWLYMFVMLAVAAMSLLSMVLLSGLIIVEKAFIGKTSWFKWLSAGIFFSLALLVIAFPSILSFA